MRAKFIIEIEADIDCEENDLKDDLLSQAEIVGVSMAAAAVKAPPKGRKAKLIQTQCQFLDTFVLEEG